MTFRRRGDDERDDDDFYDDYEEDAIDVDADLEDESDDEDEESGRWIWPPAAQCAAFWRFQQFKPPGLTPARECRPGRPDPQHLEFTREPGQRVYAAFEHRSSLLRVAAFDTRQRLGPGPSAFFVTAVHTGQCF